MIQKPKIDLKFQTRDLVVSLYAFGALFAPISLLMITTKLQSNAQIDDGASFEQPPPLQECSRMVHMLSIVSMRNTMYIRWCYFVHVARCKPHHSNGQTKWLRQALHITCFLRFI